METLQLDGKSMCAVAVAGVLLVVHDDQPVVTDEWSHYCDLASAMHKREGNLRTLMISAGPGPNASQRASYKEKVPAKNNSVAVLVDSPIIRAIVTAMSWFNPAMRAFDKHELDKALEYLDVKSARQQLEASVEELKRRMTARRIKAG